MLNRLTDSIDSTYEKKVSVIIPLTRPERVNKVLSNLQQQTYPKNLTEIVLVGPGSQKFVANHQIKAIPTEIIHYPGKVRNIGAAAANGDFLLFLDDDCEPALNWIEENVKALAENETISSHQRKPIGAVGGQIKGKSSAFFARCIDFSRFGFYQTQKRREIVVCSASLGIKKHIFQEIKGFNEQLPVEEDMDFCFRLHLKGYRTIYQPAIKVLHNHQRQCFTALICYSYYCGRTSGLYVKRLYPQLSMRNWLLTHIQHPWLYPLAMIPIATGATLNIIRCTMQEHPIVIMYAPFIFLSKIISHIGIWRWLKEQKEHKKQKEEIIKQQPR